MSKRKKDKRVTPASRKAGKGRLIGVIIMIAMLAVTGAIVTQRASLWGAGSAGPNPEPGMVPAAAPQTAPSLAKEYIYAGGKLIATEEPAGSPPAAPAAPSGLGATAVSSSQINLTWVDNSSNETGFKIERKTGAGGTYSQIATVGANTTSYQNTGLTASTTYYYRVRAYNGTGDSAYSNEANATTSGTAPAAPSSLGATAVSSSQINLTWVDNSSNETGFKIERKTGAGGTYAQIATVAANATSYQNTGLAASTTYYYRVRAYNGTGDSAFSNEANATTSGTAPAAPSSLGATAVSSSQINLSWVDNANNETGFKIERKTGAGGTYSQIATVGANVTSYQNTGLAASTTYYYRVRAYNATGDSAYSNEANATTSSGGTAPAAPSSLGATAVSSSQINLTWVDNSSNEDGFKIERKTGAGGTYSQIATVGANTTSYQNTGLTASTTYYYRVRAYNAIGDSTYSNEANATTSSGVTSRSLSLNGSSQYVDVANSSTINITGSITIEAWIKTNSATTKQTMIARYDPNVTTGFEGGYRLRISNTGQIVFATIKNASNFVEVTSSTSISAGVWTHVAGVFDGAQLRVYIGGVLRGTTVDTFNPRNGSSNLKIGMNPDGIQKFNGLLDEVRVTAAAVYTSNFTPQASLTTVTGTAGLWKFDSQTAADTSGNNNNGTLFGSPTFSTDVPGGGGAMNLNPDEQMDAIVAAAPSSNEPKVSFRQKVWMWLEVGYGIMKAASPLV